MAVARSAKRSTTCPTCGNGIRKGYRIYKWWPTGIEHGRYPEVWVCRLCFSKLVNNELRPREIDLREQETAELRAAVTKIDMSTPVELPPDVIEPAAKSPMSARR